MAVNFSGSLVATGSIISTDGFTGSLAGTASYTLTASYLASSGTSDTTASYAYTASFITASNVVGIVSNAYTASFVAASDIVGTVANAYTASYIVSSQTDATQNTRLAAIETVTGSYATTGSNHFSGQQVITGSMYITADLIVQGSSSLQNITASAVSIGTNTIILNTATPSVRFAGISVRDSGSSASTTGSLWWDSLNDRWVYQKETGSTYSGGMLISGPRNTGSLGDEEGMANNYIAKGLGGDHIGPSIIFESGSANIGIGTTTPAYKLDVKGSGQFTGSLIVTGSAFITSQVGIGTTNPNTILGLVYNNGSSGAVMDIQNTNSAGASAIDFYNNTGTYMGQIGGVASHGSLVVDSWLGGTSLRTSNTERVKLATTGQLRFNAYTTTASFSGTAAGMLAFDSSGNVITVAASSGGITGTLTSTYIPKATGASTLGNSAITDNGSNTVTVASRDLIINQDWSAGGTYPEQVSIIGTYPSICFRGSNSNYKWLFHTDDAGIFRWYGGTGYTNTTWTNLMSLTTAGNLTVGGTFTEQSSIRYKEDIQTIESGLDKVLKMRGVSYVKKDNKQKEIGVIAEEINEILPDVVNKNDDGEIESVSYGRLTAVLIEAIKEQQKQIEELKSLLGK